MNNKIKPSNAEIEFLSLASNRFRDIYGDIISDEFWDKDKKLRYYIIKDGFAIYIEMMNYEPLKQAIELWKLRLPSEAVQMCRDLFKFIRNVLQHFPYFECWDDVWINKKLVNWFKSNLSIDKFLKEYQKREQEKFRFSEPSKDRMTYLSITFPNNYTGGEKIFLKNIVTEKEGVKFLFVMMYQFLTNVIEFKYSEHQ